MGQKNMKRLQFSARANFVDAIASNVHELDFVGYLEIADIVDVFDVDGNGNILSTLATDAVVLAINPATKKVIFDVSIDTTTLVGTAKIDVNSIDDGQDAVDRLYRRKFNGAVNFDTRQNIIQGDIDTPSAGKTTYLVDDVSFFRAGDTGKVVDDDGVVAASVTIESVNINADDTNNKSSIVISTNVAINLVKNPYIQDLTIDVDKAIRRNQERLDEIDRPIKNQDLGTGDGSHLAFELADLILQGSSELHLDDGRKKLGSAGSRSALLQGSGDSAVTFESMLLGLKGNNTTVEVVAGAGINVSVAGNSSSGYAIQVTDNTGAVTSKEVADAINADADAKRIIQAIWGGNGTGVVAPFGATNLAGGLDDGTFDYAELEQIAGNNNVGTGFKWFSFHIRPQERNRMNSAPDSDEELTTDYSKAAENIDR